LQHQHPKHHNNIDRLAAGLAFLLACLRQNYNVNIGTEALKRYHPINHLQRVSLLR
jgi:hypothetical protein